MNIAQIENNISKIITKISKKTFIYDLLLAYGLPQASITRLQKGNLNLSKRPGEISWKKKVLFREEFKEDLHVTITEMVKEAKQEQRFVIVTDYTLLLAVDTKTADKLDIAIGELHKHFDFFLPWAGMEKAQHQGENPADVKAAEKMAKLFDEIKRDNPENTPEFVHNLNVFLSRLLFCYFAEDTNIFEKAQFTNAISSHTQPDGSDLGEYLDKLFYVLNTPEKERKNCPAFLMAFPYVNGGLFKLKLNAPTFTRRSRQAVIDSGDMDWSAINPDIFGSMMQAVVTPENRGGLGMHYTSVPNIMKVIEPLFLNDLYEEFERSKGSQKKLNALLERIGKIKIFDPACGSGNFLIIAYKELRKLEMGIFKVGNTMPMSSIKLSQFYGIEIDDFAHEIAQLSLWLAEHQMNVEFHKEFGKTNPTLPLREAGNIVQGNACRVDWEMVCPKGNTDEVYVLGNPPYVASFQEITDFFEKHGREPQPDVSNITEYQLYSRLNNLREDAEKAMVCESIDTHGLLDRKKNEINTIEDIFSDDNFNIFSGDSEGLFDFKHIPKETNMPEYVASRKKCKDFSKFEALLKQCQNDLRDRKRKLYPFKNEQQIAEGYFFVLKGILLYVTKVGKMSNEKGKKNARLRCIFENGTESDMLLRSLAAELYKHDRRVTEHDDKLLDAPSGVNREDEETGHIYVLKSLSSDPKIRKIQNLYKIGYSSTPIEERIKNAVEEPTYLMAAVRTVSSFKCYNMNPQKLEQLLHNFFGKSCLNIDVFDKSGNRHTPREWFIVPQDVIEQAVEFIISGEIVHYRYDEIQEIIVGK